MFGLRALTIFLATVLVQTSFGISSTVYTTVEADVRNGPLDVFDLNRNYGVSTVSETLGYRMEGLLGGAISADAAVIVSQPDYSSVLLRDENQAEINLADITPNRNEVAGNITLDWLSGTHALSVNWTGSVSESPFAYQSASLNYNKSFFNNSTILGVGGVYLSQNAPESFYIGTDFVTRKRPTRINGVEVSMTGEQTITENWKALARVALSQRIEERPKNISVSLSQGYAFADQFFTELKFTYASELRGDSLKDDRGYFQNVGATLGVTLEPLYDFLVSASYGLLVETEDDPRTGRSVRVAGDQVGLGLTYRLRKLELNVQSSFVQTNTRVENLNVSGGIRWNI